MHSFKLNNLTIVKLEEIVLLYPNNFSNIFCIMNRELQRMDSITNSPIVSHFAETIQGVATIRAYNQESRFMEMLFKRLEANNIAVMCHNTSNRWLGIALVRTITIE